jgi:CheY-like chemotaxis protein
MPHKLLLADDSVTIQRVIELTFADEDVHVQSVGDGKKAIASIQSDRPDIVLADVGMPERDGYEVAEFIKSNPQLANIPVLLLTGAFEPIDETRARAVGCDGVLVKPFEPQMVINRVKDLLAGRRPGGLWGAKPAPPAPVRDVPHEPAPKEASPPADAAAAAQSTSASLEDYFDRLDAAFASVEAATEARSATPPRQSAAITPAPAAVSAAGSPPPASPSGLSMDDLAGWDPDLAGDPQKPVGASTSTVEAVTLPPPPAPPAPVISLRPAAPVREPEQMRPAAPEPAAPVMDTPLAPPRGEAPLAARVSEAPAVAAPVVEPPPAAPAVAPPPMASVSAEPPAVETVQTPAAAKEPQPIPSLAQAFAALLSAEQARPLSASAVGTPTISDDTLEDIVRQVIARMSDQVVREQVLGVAERLVREEIERIKQKQ